MVILITTNAFTRTSAGVYSQHKLCKKLRDLGYDAYLVFIGNSKGVNPEWNTPIWPGTSSPIFSVAIYSELIHGNPLRASLCIYWILGDFIIQPDPSKTDGAFFYWHSNDSFSLRLNNLDIDFFTPREEIERNNYVVYRAKNSNWKPSFSTSEQVVFVDRFGSQRIPRAKFRDLLHSANALVIAEDSLVIEEAIIAGCPVIVEPGVTIHRYGRPIPSIYMRESELDWPDINLLRENIESSRKLLIREGQLNEATFYNLLAYLSHALSASNNLSLPPTSLTLICKIRIKFLRIFSAYRKGGMKNVLHLLFEVLRP